MKKDRLSLETALAANQRFKEKEYWLNKLAGFPDKVGFPFDRKKGEDGRRTNTVTQTFPGEISASLARIGKGVDHALHMILTASLVILLHKYTGSDDIVVGMPIYKQSMDIEFINTVVALRNTISPGMTFKEVLLQVRQNIDEAVEHQNYPIDVLTGQLKGPIEDNDNEDFPLFDIVVLLENIHDKSYIRDICFNQVWCFNFNKADNRLDVSLDYNALFYEETTIFRIIDHLMTLVQAVLADVNLPIPGLSLITGPEKKRLLEEFCGANEPVLPHHTLFQWFEEQVEKTPDHTALKGPDNHAVTYKDLNRRVNQLTCFLRDRGVCWETIVGLMAERSVEMVMGLLAIMKSGGSYLAIDAEYPESRKKYMIENSGISLLLINMDNVRAERFASGNIRLIDIRDRAIYSGAGENPEPLIDNPAAGLMYVIYTSGTTGQPKGIMMEHRNLVNMVRFMRDYTSIDYTRVLQFSNISFDVAYQETFGTLVGGGTVFLVDRDTRQDIAELFRLVERNDIRSVFLPASFVKFIFNRDEYSEYLPRRVKHIITAGEQLVVSRLLRDYLVRYNISLHNHYGPTEAHVVTSLTLGPGVEIPELPCIGRPVLNTSINIVDPQENLLPVGVPGEVVVSSAQVGRGYLNKPEMTAEKFIEYRSYRTHRTYRTYRTYKTGDLARWLPDPAARGAYIIEFLGRRDFQVKVRGFRIELGEIESQLMKHPGIKEVVVIDREGERGEKYLCAYIVFSGGAAIDRIAVNTELREYLSRTLPDYMIPSYFVPLKNIPLTPNKKVDRRALPEPHITAGDAYVPPGTPLQKKLVETWSQILGIEGQHIGIDDNFFSLGGHSLKATVLVSRLNKVLGANVLLAEMFTYPTIRELAGHIEGSGRVIHADIEPVEEKEYYPLSPAQKRLYVLQQMDKNNMSYNMPGAVIVEGDLEKEKLTRVFKRLIERHESLRTSFQVVNDEPVQRIHDEPEFEIENYPATEEGAFIRPFDLSRAPLLRLGLIKTGEKTHTLMFDMHHIITDGTSQGIFTREFMQLYAGRELPLLNLQYKDYSQWLRSAVRTEALKKQEVYWLNRFKGEAPVLALPYDSPRPAVSRFEGDRQGFLLEEGETAALRRKAARHEATLYMILLAVFNVLLWKLSGQEDIIVGTPIAARRHADLEPIIGMFVNTLAMRHFPSGEKTFKAFLNEVKTNTLKAFENQEYPFEELVEKANVPRDAGRNPLFDVMFALQNWERGGGEIPGLVLKPYPFENRTAKFDLNLDAVEMAGCIAFSLEYGTALFKEDTIKRFSGYLTKIITHVASPGGMDTELSRIDILEAEEKQQLLEMANGPQEPPDMNQTIHGLFDVQVERMPEKIAAVGKGERNGESVQLTYRELDEKAGQLAVVLKERGVLADEIVGIMMEPSIELIIGILGILKAGGAYLPIDPEYPAERKQYMLADSGAGILLTNLPEGRLIFHSSNRFITHHHPGNLLYIIYTSGSTGKPKGVMLEHRNLLNLILYQYRHTCIDFSRVLQFTTISFDVSFQEIFSTLLAGGTLFVVNKELKQDISGIFNLVEKNNIMTLFLPASFLKFVLSNEAYLENMPPGVTHIVTAGEQPVVTPVFRKYIVSKKIKLHNHYGPSETHVVTTLTLDPEIDEIIPDLPSMGRPISNTGIYIVDKEGQLQPYGAAGELWIAGASVGRGYLNRPELTYEKLLRGVQGGGFLEKSPPGRRRLYRTGDLARWLGDGNLEFLGRLDHQVKIRGFRVELGEIENCLMALEGIKEAVVTARRDERGESRLYAYVVPENEREINVSLLRQRLSTRLPDFMIPGRFIKIDQIPLTPSKKVDRGALPAPETARPQVEAAYLAPFTRMEKLIADTWKGVLSLDKIGINDNFFDLGGNSLSLIKTNNKLKEILRKEIPVMTMFQYPTVHSLAQHLMQEEKQNEISAAEREDQLKKLDKGKTILKATLKKMEELSS
jgi:amino acid adenylation domain-containing protein